MKRWLWYLAVLAAVAALSGKAAGGKEIGNLQPVQTVAVSRSGGQVMLCTDTGNWGAGATLSEAVQDMNASAAGEIFLKTADYLLLSPNCIDLLPEIMVHLRPSCGVCLMEGQPDLEQTGMFLQHHDVAVTLNLCRAGERNLQTLITQEGRMKLVS